VLPRCTFIRAFIIRGSNPFVKYSHLKPICINKGSFLKEITHSKIIRFHLEVHTTPNFSSCSQTLRNRFICKRVLYWFLTIFLPVSAAPTQLLHTRASLSTTVSASTPCIKERPWHALASAFFWFPKKGCTCAVHKGHVKGSSQVPHDGAIWISSHSETCASSAVCI